MTSAIFTLLYSDDYLPGALVLAIALKKLFAKYQSVTSPKLCVLIDRQAFSANHLHLLSEFYDDLVDIDPIITKDEDILNNDLGRPDLDKTYSKILLWSLTQYDKILYLDADTLPNINGSLTVVDLLNLDFPQNKILAAPDSGFPDIFNSGMFMLRPNIVDFNRLSQLASSSDGSVSFDGADQGLLNQYFNPNPDWVSDLLSSNRTNVSEALGFTTSSWIKLPFLYNVTPSAQYEYLPAFKHFTDENGPGDQSRGQHYAPGAEECKYAGVSETLGRYHSTAASYFNSGSSSAFGVNAKTKLVHYIGPFKPWNSNRNDSSYGEWWSLWFSQFHDTIENVLGWTSEEAPTTIEEDSQPYKDSHTERSTFDPSTLCDPVNYQHIPDSVRPSADALWNPANAPPPAPEPDYKSTFEIGEFKSSWDEEPHEAHQETQQVVAEPPSNETAIEPGYGYHPSQRPERVFDSSQDFVLNHPLYNKSSVEDTRVKEDDEEQEGEATVAQVEERFQEMGLVENEVEMDPDINEEDHFNHGSSQLFPWERNQRRAERVFDW
ncbi:Glycogenin-2 [Meyerozyma sp. JA9]|nr:Glycogenin-2 [Meyerozyma sp. JA9]